MTLTVVLRFIEEVIKSIHVYGEMHRYIPLIAAQNGYTKIGEKIVKHQTRRFDIQNLDKPFSGFH